MTTIVNTGLSARHRTVMMHAAVTLATLTLFTQGAAAQQQPQGRRDDLDVTMQIIVDPDAKLPDEVVRRIPVPTRKPVESPPAAARDNTGKQETGPPGQDRDRAANEHGKETSDAARERGREAAEQREAARQAAAEERRRREHPDHPEHPEHPEHPKQH